MKSFTDLVRDYSAWKLQEKGNGKLTRGELNNLRESFRKMSSNRPIRENFDAALKARVLEYRKWKLAEKGTDKITQKEFNTLKESITRKGNDWDTYLKNYKQFKESQESQEGKNAKISYKELKMLKENFKEAESRGLRLREADMGAAPAPAPATDPNMGGADAGFDPAAGGADPNASGVQDPMALQGAIDQAFAALQPFTQSGANPMGADPNAGLPPVDGMQPTAPTAGDPNAMAAPIQEMVNNYRAWKKANKGTDKLTEAEIVGLKKEAMKLFSKPKSRYDQIKERIAARQAEINGLQENSMGPLPTSELANSKLWKHNKGNSAGTSGGDDASPYASIPSAGSLANGYTSGKGSGETKAAKTWPTKATGKEAGGALQGAGATQTKVKENSDPDTPAEDKLEEGAIKTVTDVYVERHLEPKLNFKKLKEAMSKGLLG